MTGEPLEALQGSKPVRSLRRLHTLPTLYKLAWPPNMQEIPTFSCYKLNRSVGGILWRCSYTVIPQ